MTRFTYFILSGAVALSLSSPAAALTVDEVDKAMDARIEMLNFEITELREDPGSNTGQQNAEIRKLEARVKQIESQQRLLGKSKTKEKQLEQLVARFDLDIVSPH